MCFLVVGRWSEGFAGALVCFYCSFLLTSATVFVWCERRREEGRREWGRGEGGGSSMPLCFVLFLLVAGALVFFCFLFFFGGGGTVPRRVETRTQRAENPEKVRPRRVK